MSGLLEEMSAKALRLNIPLNVQLDLTYRCNERCVHCYLDHDDHGEMTTTEIKHLLDEMADAGVFILTLSGGEIFLRKDFFEILEHARRLMFCVKLKTNAVLIREREAARLLDLGVESVQISIYSHRPEVHDAITLVPGSLKRSLDAIRFLKAQGLKVIIANVLMTENMRDYTRRSGARRRTGRRMHTRSHRDSDDGRQSFDAKPVAWIRANCARFSAMRLWSAMSMSSAPYLLHPARTSLKRHLAVPVTPPATCRLTAKFSRACNFPTRPGMFASSASLTSGDIRNR